jgi:type II secretory pathway pseudopilin PulG
MQWLVAGVLLVLGLVAMPLLVGWTKRAARRRRFGGAAMMLAMAFASVLDPARAAAMETLDKQKKTGEAQPGADGSPDDAPISPEIEQAKPADF